MVCILITNNSYLKQIAHQNYHLKVIWVWERFSKAREQKKIRLQEELEQKKKQLKAVSTLDKIEKMLKETPRLDVYNAFKDICDEMGWNCPQGEKPKTVANKLTQTQAFYSQTCDDDDDDDLPDPLST